MAARRWIRWTGLIMIVAGLLWIVGFAGMAHMLPIVTQMGGHWLLGVAGMLTLVGVAGLLSYTRGNTSTPGLIAYGVTMLGATVFATGNIAEAGFGIEFGTVLFGVGLLTLSVGVTLLGSTLLRSRVLPAWSIWPLMLGLVAFLPVVGLGGATFGPDSGVTTQSAVWVLLAWFGTVLLGGGWIILGFALWTERVKWTRPAPTRP